MSLWPIIILGATVFVAYANGANDNFKGVATLFGSGTTGYRRALTWATSTTFAGSITAFFLATKLASMFQGKGLVPDFLIRSERFLAAVILGAALTVMLATKIGMPISTTHGLTGALFGGGFVAVGNEIGFSTLLTGFFMPLLISPVVAVALAAAGYPLLCRAIASAGLTKESCVCVGNEMVPVVVTPDGVMFTESTPGLRVIVDRTQLCTQRLSGNFFGVNGQSVLDCGHFLSAGAVSFARGLNDTPKLVALGLAVSVLDFASSIALVAIFMAIGGLIHAKKIAETVGQRITAMDPDQGFFANLVTSFLVIFASKWGMPVSTTHVSCGALFGIGIANGQARWAVIRTILLAWVLTLPTAALLSAASYLIFRKLA
ncbi:MAG: inorganic phosphate transporter [Deltaproteobacteria bacterium]|nr:inorganic phosphate transporter [Deltaproteobacteria bacterium]